MKILQIVKTNRGAYWAFEQAKWLHENGVDITTVLPSKNEGLALKYIENGMKIIGANYSLPIFKPWKYFKRKKKIRKQISEINPDIIHSHFVTNTIMLRLALRKTDIPRLFQVPGPLHLENVFFRKGEILFSNKQDYWAGACKKTNEYYLKEGISKDKVFLAYYGGYGGDTINQYGEANNVLRREHNISKEKIIVGMVSYFYKPKRYLLQFRGLKGHEDFIDAIALSRKTNPTIVGVIIGDAWGNSSKYVQKVKKYAKKKCGDNIIFTGFRGDMKKIYKELNVAVHPSHTESLGGAAESLAAGVPTISTNVGGFPDIVIDNETGYTVKAKKPNQLSKTIIKTIDNYQASLKMAQNGQDLIRDLLDINKTASNIKKIYHKIIENDVL